MKENWGSLAASLLFASCAATAPTTLLAEKLYGPPQGGSCVSEGHGPGNAAALPSPSLLQTPQQCTATRFVYQNFPISYLNDDVDLLIGSSFFSSGYPYMNDERINVYLKSLDADTLNEFHKRWRDFELNFNYFQGSNPTRYYGTFGVPANMDFEFFNVPDAEENHIDIFMNHPSDGVPSGTYPYLGPPEPREDGDPASCSDDYRENSVSIGAGFKSVVDTCGWIAVEDPNWHIGGEYPSLETQHEVQHLMSASRGGNSGPGFPGEAFSMAAEYLVGAGIRDGQRAIRNLPYDRGLVNVAQSGGFDYGHYTNWYLWGIYLSQKFSGDTTMVEDDLLYKWVRNRNEFGVYDQEMHGLAHVLEDSAYASLGGATGPDRLRNLYHNYVLAKWINNPSPSFYGGRLGFTRGIVPSETPGYFHNDFAPFQKESAVQVPPRFVVGRERVASDSTYGIGAVWQTTDVTCNGPVTSIDSIGIWLYGSDYIQFDADPYFTSNGKRNTFRFRMNWDPAAYPGGGSKNSLRVCAISYSSGGDSLYLKGSSVTGLAYAFVDSLHGFAQVWVPNFGANTKSVVIAIDMGEVTPPGSGRNPRKLYYGYSFGVDETSPVPQPPFSLTAVRTGGPVGTDYLRIDWTAPVGCGGAGFIVQRSPNNTSTWSNRATVSTYSYADTVPYGLYFYRVITGGAPACMSSDTQSSALRRHPVFRTHPPVNRVVRQWFGRILLS